MAADADGPVAGSATCVYVAFGIDALDLSWLPSGVEVIVVHNDDNLASINGPVNVVHIRPGRNVGFGAGVNLAAARASGDRLVVVNPDTRLTASHWRALTEGDGSDLRTIPLNDGHGDPTVVMSRHFTPARLLVSALRLRRLLRRMAPRLGRSRRPEPQRATGIVRDWWLSGAVLSIPTALFLAVGGFDERYFLYYEDADLFRRWADRFPATVVRVMEVEPGVHAVGGSATATTAGLRRRSALLYASTAPGWGWRVTAALIRLSLVTG